MKRHHRIFPALLVLILASLACGLYPSGEVETYGRVTCTLVDYDWSKQLNGDAEYICSCPSAPFEETNIDNRYLDQEGPGLESKLCAAPSQSDQPSSSVPLVENFAATEPPVLPTPTNTPLPPPVIGGIAACDFVSKYVNIKMQTDASFDPQLLQVNFKNMDSTARSSCELVPGSGSLYTCRIPDTTVLPASFEISYLGKPVYIFELNTGVCNTSDHRPASGQPEDNQDVPSTEPAPTELDCSQPGTPGC